MDDAETLKTGTMDRVTTGAEDRNVAEMGRSMLRPYGGSKPRLKVAGTGLPAMGKLKGDPLVAGLGADYGG